MLCLEKIEGVIWDMDGVLHPYLPFAQSLPHWNRAAVRAFNKVAGIAGIEHNLTAEEAEIEANISFRDKGLSTKFFTQTYKLCPEQMHLEFHRETALQDVISSHAELPALFDRMGHLKHIILSQGSREWIERCLDANGLSKYFGDAILGFEDVGMEKKSESPRPFKAAIDLSGIAPSRLVIPEDMKRNLKIAKQHFGMQTVFVAESGLEPEWVILPTLEDDYIDLSVQHTTDFVNHLLKTPAYR